jgi:hypothetical protein
MRSYPYGKICRAGAKMRRRLSKYTNKYRMLEGELEITAERHRCYGKNANP